MSELDVEAIDLGDELRQGIQLRLGLAPVVIRSPIADERLDPGQLHALGLIGDGLPVGPTGGGDAATEVDERSGTLTRNGRMALPRPRRRNAREAGSKAPAAATVRAAALRKRRRSGLFGSGGWIALVRISLRWLFVRKERETLGADWTHRQARSFANDRSIIPSRHARRDLYRIRSIRIRSYIRHIPLNVNPSDLIASDIYRRSRSHRRVPARCQINPVDPTDPATPGSPTSCALRSIRLISPTAGLTSRSSRNSASPTRSTSRSCRYGRTIARPSAV